MTQRVQVPKHEGTTVDDRNPEFLCTIPKYTKTLPRNSGGIVHVA